MSTNRLSSRTNSIQRDMLLAFAAFLVAFALWQMQGLFFVTYPLRLFVTMIHELGHGTAAILTGGSFVRFEVSQRGAGLAYTSGGMRFVVIQAGYVGAALFGAALLFLTNRSGRPGAVAIGLGLIIGVLTLLFAGISLANLSLIETVLVIIVIIAALVLILTQETDNGRYAGVGVAAVGGVLLVVFGGSGHNTVLTVMIGLGSALILCWLGYRASRDIVVVVLNFLAFLTGLQAITDAWILLKIVSLPHSMMPHNDASSMAREIGGSAGLWALIWITLDILIFGLAVYHTFVRPLRQESRTTV